MDVGGRMRLLTTRTSASPGSSHFHKRGSGEGEIMAWTLHLLYEEVTRNNANLKLN
jgi:hypothetical protein